MEQYIPKSVLVAEIENLLDKGKYYDDYECAFRDGNNSALYALKGKINILEVKEMDLSKYINKYFKGWYVDLTDQGNILHTPDGNAGLMSVKEAAKHFFELGLRASQPTTSVYGIEEALKENGIDPDSKEADMCREAIYKIYDRLQAQKGDNNEL